MQIVSLRPLRSLRLKISSAADTAAIQRVGGVAAFSRFLEASAVSVADFVRDPEWLSAAKSVVGGSLDKATIEDLKFNGKQRDNQKNS